MRRFSGEELKSLALELPEDVLKYKDFGDLEKAKEAADRWLEQPIGEELKTRLRYEKFILEYYSQHHTYLSEVKAGQVKWDLVGDNSESMIRFLPIMQTDIMLRLNEKILIIDAKYYGRTLQKQFDKYTLHSNNVYQIFTYVKNQDKNNTGDVAGILLYAKTDEDITPDVMFNMGGNQIGAKTLDLNKEFSLIVAQLDKIAEDYFGKQAI